MIKAIAGGGGRGMRIVDDAAKLEQAYARCQSEAMAGLRQRRRLCRAPHRNARHIEVQIICDHYGAISHLAERECTIQRRNQKLIEVAPSLSLNDALRGRIIDAAKELAAAANYDNLGTFEFLVDNDAKPATRRSPSSRPTPRLQVEHTVTEQVLGLDLVQSQLAVAAGATLGSLGLAQAYIPKPRGFAMQLRVNMEVMDETGGTKAHRRDAGAVRPAVRPRRSRRYLWLLRLPHQHRLRLAARQGHRAFAGRQLDRRRAQGHAHAPRVPHRRRRHQHPLPDRDFRRIRISSRIASQHRLHRGPCRRSRRRSQRTAETALEIRDRVRDAADDGRWRLRPRLGLAAGSARARADAGHDRRVRRRARANSFAPASRSPCWNR